MARRGSWSLLRRRGTPAGGLALLCVVLAMPAQAATPAPDPPPEAVAPEPPPVTGTQPEPVRSAPVIVTPAPVVHRAAPVTRAQPAQAPAAKPKPVAKAKPKAVARPAPKPVAATRVPHDRSRVPLAAVVTVNELDRSLLTVAGIALLLVALGGAVLLAAARRQLIVAGLGLFALLAPSANAATPPASYTLAGTAGANGWYVSNVTISFAWTTENLVSTSGCDAKVIGSEGINTPSPCVVNFTWGSVTVPPPDVRVRIDKTAPTGVTGALARAPDSDGWYNRPVTAAFSGQDAVSGVAGCSGPTYAGTDSASAGLSGTCTDVAGNTSAAASVGFKYDATAPAVTPQPERPPDHRGWYRKPLTVTFTGTDITSGVAFCSAPARYAGPDLAKAAVVGSCRDRAGNSAEAGHTFQYDDTAPALARTQARLEKGVARIGWARAGDVVAVQLVRSPGINGAKSTIVYKGKGGAFVDKTVKAGKQYRYEISVADLAGNVTTKAVTIGALTQTALYSPAAGTVVRAPPLLRWKAVKGATFYNVQVYRNGRKLLSTWPGLAKLKLARTWTYGGKRYRFEPGKYTWYVWGARGTRAKPVYGKVLGSSTFSVKR
jgi:hypothetical protein